MAIVRFNPSREMDSLRSEMDRLFDGFFSTGNNRDAAPVIRVWENAEAFTVQAIVPGLDRNSLDIQAGAYGVTFGGKFVFPVPEGVTVRHSEYGSGEFRRTLQLATQVRPDQVKASYADGLLNITLPKSEAARVVKVKLDDTETVEAQAISQ